MNPNYRSDENGGRRYPPRNWSRNGSYRPPRRPRNREVAVPPPQRPPPGPPPLTPEQLASLPQFERSYAAVVRAGGDANQIIDEPVAPRIQAAVMTPVIYPPPLSEYSFQEPNRVYFAPMNPQPYQYLPTQSIHPQPSFAPFASQAGVPIVYSVQPNPFVPAQYISSTYYLSRAVDVQQQPVQANYDQQLYSNYTQTFNFVQSYGAEAFESTEDELSDF